jgi:hypothetical protein
VCQGQRQQCRTHHRQHIVWVLAVPLGFNMCGSGHSCVEVACHAHASRRAQMSWTTSTVRTAAPPRGWTRLPASRRSCGATRSRPARSRRTRSLARWSRRAGRAARVRRGQRVSSAAALPRPYVGVHECQFGRGKAASGESVSGVLVGHDGCAVLHPALPVAGTHRPALAASQQERFALALAAL